MATRTENGAVEAAENTDVSAAVRTGASGAAVAKSEAAATRDGAVRGDPMTPPAVRAGESEAAGVSASGGEVSSTVGEASAASGGEDRSAMGEASAASGGEMSAMAREAITAALREEIAATLKNEIAAALKAELATLRGELQVQGGGAAAHAYRVPVTRDASAMSDAEYYRARLGGQSTLR